MKLFILTQIFLLSAFLTAEEKKENWQSLFNGKDLSGWEIAIRGQDTDKDKGKYFSVHEGNLHIYKDTHPDEMIEYGVIMSKKSYKNYRLKFEYKWGEKRFAPRKYVKRDTGLLVHAYDDNRNNWRGGAWPLSVECQIQETDTGDFHFIGPRAKIKSSAVKFQRDKNHFYKYDENSTNTQLVEFRGRTLKSHQNDYLYIWNTVEAVVIDGDATFYVNGLKVMEAIGLEYPVGEYNRKKKNTWKPLLEGKIGFQCEGAEVMYKNIEILELPEVKK
ncbi:MAG: DUF1080 domain-containing protein [Lentisphaeraceae bacterium]|nr:DUF1080 domain-containing protein [Lentisphaeraceae bacterium]